MSWISEFNKWRSYIESQLNVGGVTLQELLAQNFLRKDVNGNIIDGASNIISGSPAVADYTALVALDEATYKNFAVVTEALNRGVFLSDGTLFSPLNGQYIQEVQTLPGNRYIYPADYTVVASDSPLTPGKVRLTFASPHGMLETDAEGSYLYLLSGGAGWTAGTDHRITPGSGWISTTAVDLDTAYTGGMGVPVFARVGSTASGNSTIPHKVITLPALRPNTLAIVVYEMIFSSDATANKRVQFLLDTTTLVEHVTSAANRVLPYRHGFRNQNNASAQRSITGDNGTGYAGSTGPLVEASVATGTAGKTITISTTLGTTPTTGQGVTAQLNGYAVIIQG